MTRRRCELSAAEVSALHEQLERQLEQIGLTTQPTVAVRLLELVQDPDAQLKHYVEVIRNDWTLTGRLLRLANSAYYAQRAPVTKLDRALILLGLERTKGISLGFYLSRAASPAGGPVELSRRVWGESVYRAGLCSALAKHVCPTVAAEAFIIGLMLDCGQPMMSRLLGEDYDALHRDHPSPPLLFAAEFETLPFTHVDVATVLMKRWKLPPVLSRPIGFHHTLPPVGETSDPAVLLHRVAYYAGAVQVAGLGEQATPPPENVARRLFDISPDELSVVVSRADSEYRATVDLFASLATRCENLELLAEQVQFQLIELMDQQLARSIQLESKGGSQHVIIGGQRVDLEPGRGGDVIAFISSSTGERLLSCTINPAIDGPDNVCGRLGLEQVGAEEVDELMRAVRDLAA